MRIGLLPGSPRKGGIYQYSLSVIEALDPSAAAAEGDELVVLSEPSSALDLDALAREGWHVAPPVPPTPKRASGPGRLRAVVHAASARARRRTGREVIRHR